MYVIHNLLNIVLIISPPKFVLLFCHPERSEGSRVHPRGVSEILHFVQNDKCYLHLKSTRLQSQPYRFF